LLIAISANAEPIPFDASQNLVEIEVTINGNIKAVFGVDTGADRLYIDEAFAKAHNLQFYRGNARGAATSVEGKSDARQVKVERLEFGGQKVESIRASAVNLSELVPDKRGRVPDGLIGWNILREFYTTVDYPNHTIEFDRDKPRILTGNSYEEIDFTKYGHLILVDVTLNRLHETTMILDYCASHTVISDALAEKMNLTPDEHRLTNIDKIELGHKTTSKDVRTVVLDLTHYRHATPRAQYEGILGGTFLKDLKITVDYGHSKIYVHSR